MYDSLNSNMTSDTIGAVTAGEPNVISSCRGVHVAQSLRFCVVLCPSLFVCYPFLQLFSLNIFFLHIKSQIGYYNISVVLSLLQKYKQINNDIT
jgi:hypothetical protein